MESPFKALTGTPNPQPRLGPGCQGSCLPRRVKRDRDALDGRDRVGHCALPMMVDVPGALQDHRYHHRRKQPDGQNLDQVRTNRLPSDQLDWDHLL